MPRAFLFVLDSFGIGGAPDAAEFGDDGADTLGHIAERCANGGGDRNGLRSGQLALPNMAALGLGLAARSATGSLPAGFSANPAIEGVWANAVEVSRGKDTPSGHWEMAGVPVLTEWGYFPDTVPAFPKSLTDAILERTGLPGILGNCHASGTEIIERLGEEHIRTGKPICYTSADSVFQIAAHETHFGLERLYELCRAVFDLTAPMNIGRVIARPFTGETSGEFVRTGNRRDFSVLPPSPTLLDLVKASGREMIAIGKIADIYAHSGPTRVIKASGNAALADATLAAMADAPDGSMLMTNFVDFDMLYGHRRDVPGYANALEEFDLLIPRLRNAMRRGDLMILTADHGNDPTWPGTDHTREQVPVMAFGPGLAAGSAGRRDSFADIGATIAEHLGIAGMKAGTSFLAVLEGK